LQVFLCTVVFFAVTRCFDTDLGPTIHLTLRPKRAVSPL
jgi:hypothetical protein